MQNSGPILRIASAKRSILAAGIRRGHGTADKLDEGAELRGLLHLGNIHEHGGIHRVRDHHVLHALAASLAEQHQAFGRGRMARREHQPVLGDERDDLLHGGQQVAVAATR